MEHTLCLEMLFLFFMDLFVKDPTSSPNIRNQLDADAREMFLIHLLSHNMHVHVVTLHKGSYIQSSSDCIHGL